MIVRFSDEIEYLDAYLELQQVRYQNRFQVEMKMDKGISELYIPKMLLQPIIENAILHGIVGKAEEEGKITIKAWESDPSTLEIQIIDNGIGMDMIQINEITARLQNTEDSDLHSIGLRNVYQRIILLFGLPYGLHITSTNGQGTVVTVSLPKMTTKELDQHV
jgi:two-component system sensor histidine kinase YesM